MVRQIPAIIEFLGYDPEPEPKGLPAKIAYARRRLGWTQEDLAVALKVGDVAIYYWEKGTVVPSADKLAELQQHLGNRFIL